MPVSLRPHRNIECANKIKGLGDTQTPLRRQVKEFSNGFRGGVRVAVDGPEGTCSYLCEEKSRGIR